MGFLIGPGERRRRRKAIRGAIACKSRHKPECKGRQKQRGAGRMQGPAYKALVRAREFISGRKIRARKHAALRRAGLPVA
eukprot:4499340-Pyramimonas_sp.AAC.1